MIIFYRTICFILFCICYSNLAYPQNNSTSTISLNDLDAFSNPGKNWNIVSDVSADFNDPGLVKFLSGKGILVNTSKKDGDNLLTKAEFGDVEINLDFMTSKAGNSAIYLQGRYGIKLSDSWMKLNPTFNDMGGIEQRKGEPQKEYEGTPPLTNVTKAPGLWQHLKVKFRAPKFENGVKITNARFEEVYLNGTLIQVQNELTGPTSATMFKDEKAFGPLMLQGNRGTVAFRKISVLPLKPLPDHIVPKKTLAVRKTRVVNPILLKANDRPYLLRSFLDFENKKRTHVISVGNPSHVNYSYDLKQGALLQIWRGEFLDVTQMWEDRGESQLARPLGSVIILSGAPALAALSDKNTAWPDLIAFDDFQNKGYTLDKERAPTFLYTYNTADVTDKISVENNGESLRREIAFQNGPEMLYCRIAVANAIQSINGDLYVIDDKQYYISIDSKFKPFIRSNQNRQELIVPVAKNKPLTYSIIW